jgi:hypothetical protein
LRLDCTGDIVKTEKNPEKSFENGKKSEIIIKKWKIFRIFAQI